MTNTALNIRNDENISLVLLVRLCALIEGRCSKLNSQGVPEEIKSIWKEQMQILVAEGIVRSPQNGQYYLNSKEYKRFLMKFEIETLMFLLDKVKCETSPKWWKLSTRQAWNYIIKYIFH